MSEDSNYSSKSDYTSESDSSVSSDEMDQHDDNLKLEGNFINKYNVITEIGRGGYAIVWLVYNIENKQFYAMKVQHSDDYIDGLSELALIKRIPSNLNQFNKLIDYFVHKVKIGKKKEKKYVCFVFELCVGNLDTLIRKGTEYKNGLPKDSIKTITKNILEGLNFTHRQLKVFHGDIKPDNLLLEGVNERDEYIINRYNEYDFPKNYYEAKIEFLKSKNNEVNKKNLKKIKSEKKAELRLLIHSQITNFILNELENMDLSKYKCDKKYIENPKVVLCDFGSFCSDDEEYNNDFGTRYYRAPEVILVGDCDYKVDMWAFGCTLYELITGEVLFDPIKTKEFDRNYFQLKQMEKMCSPFTKNFLKSTKNYKNYFKKSRKDYKLKQCEKETNFEKLQDLLQKKLDHLDEKENLKDLLVNILQTNPKKRISALQALNHKYFSNNH